MLLERAADHPEESAAIAERLERSLTSRGLSLARLAEATRHGLRGDRRMRIPEGFAARIRRGHAPHVYHVLALHEAANIDLYESLAIFGYDLEDIPLLQAALHQERTVLLRTTIYDRRRSVDWPAAFDEDLDPARGEFVSELVPTIERRPASALNAACPPNSIYVRLGQHARNLVPALVPGSIVRVDRSDRGQGQRTVERPVYLVAHLRGLTCTYVDWVEEGRIALVPRGHVSSPVIYRLNEEAVILGRVRAELRPLQVPAEGTATTGPSTGSGRGRDHCAARLVLPDPERQTFGRFLRSARETIGMTHRDAHEISTIVARAYGDRRFAIGVGTLSDWESQDDLPLHVQHLFSLAVCYSVSFGDLLRAAKVVERDPFMAPDIEPSMGDVRALPPALLHAVRIAVQRSSLSWDDVFRCGIRATVFDRSVAGARYLIVDRRDRRLARADRSATLDRSLYVLRDTQGRQICSGCFAEGRNLYVQPDPRLALQLRGFPRESVSIRGRVLAALRER